MALWSDDKITTKLMPTQLYVDIMIMVKNVYFCVAKAKADNLKGKFHIIQLGTDCLETLFGILCTMVGNDANLDILQLGQHLTGTTEVSTILAKYPHWVSCIIEFHFFYHVYSYCSHMTDALYFAHDSL
jgi:hypothetical protein